MSDIKNPVSRIHVGRGATPGALAGRSELEKPISGLPARVERDTGSRADPQIRGSVLVSEFIAPPRETAEWLGNPSMPAALAAVSGELAPGGVATSKRNQYVASVVETHLAARKQLASHLNALLRA